MALQEINAQKWLRCNRCFREMGRHQFFLTFCSHVLCNNCLKTAREKNECPLCRCKDLRTVSVTEAMNKEEIKHCFECIEGPFDKLRQASLFQKRQLLLNSKRLHNIEKKYLNCKLQYQHFLKENKTLKEQNTKLLNKLNELLQENQELKARNLETVAYMTPETAPYSQNPQQFCQNSRINASHFQPLHLERSNLNPNVTIRMLPPQNAEFLVPTSSRIPRSVGSSTRSSNTSLRGTPFTNYTPNPTYRS